MDTFDETFALVEDTLTEIKSIITTGQSTRPLEDTAHEFKNHLTSIYNEIHDLYDGLRETWKSPAVQMRLKELFTADAQKDLQKGLKEWKSSWRLHSAAPAKNKSIPSLDDPAYIE